MGWGWPVEPITRIREIRRELDAGECEPSRITTLAENALKATSELTDHFEEAQEVLRLLKTVQPIEDKPFHQKIWGASYALFEKEFAAWKDNPAIKGRKDVVERKIRHVLLPYRDQPKTYESSLLLADANLTKLPPLTALFYLKHFDLRGNQLQNVPPSFQNLDNLVSLFIGENPIQWTAEEINKLPLSLQELSLANAGLVSLPEEMGRLINLRWLEVSDNPDLKALPNALAHLPRLKTIETKGTAIPQEEVQKILRRR